MTSLSVNINKVATLRNARGGDCPNLLEVALDCENFGAQGITVHPRPDERHIRYTDVFELKKNIKTEFNIEGYPSNDFIQLVLKAKPAQVTLVPDPPEAITSNAGWDVKNNFEFLELVIRRFKEAGIRTSVFMDPNIEQITKAAETGTDRIELYTEEYAVQYESNPEQAIKKYKEAAEHALKLGLELNAGHDLNQNNLKFFSEQVPGLKEVSIGHALISDALYDGLKTTIGLYLDQLKK